MARLFSNSEYIDIVYGEACESTPRAQRISVQLLLVTEGLPSQLIQLNF
jgi:hypothetical protein